MSQYHWQRDAIRTILEGNAPLGGNDHISGSWNAEYIEAGDGDDKGFGNGGDDVIFGQKEDDFLTGFSASDIEIVKNDLGGGHQKDGLILGDDKGAIFFEDVLNIQAAIDNGQIVFDSLANSPIEELRVFIENPADVFDFV